MCLMSLLGAEEDDDESQRGGSAGLCTISCWHRGGREDEGEDNRSGKFNGWAPNEMNRCAHQTQTNPNMAGTAHHLCPSCKNGTLSVISLCLTRSTVLLGISLSDRFRRNEDAQDHRRSLPCVGCFRLRPWRRRPPQVGQGQG